MFCLAAVLSPMLSAISLPCRPGPAVSRTGWRGVYHTKGLRLQMKRRVRGPALTKAELRARGEEALAAATKPVVKLPTKLVRQCGRCGEFSSVMVEPGEEAPPFKCKVCDKPARGG
jgi:hypothetical protein